MPTVDAWPGTYTIKIRFSRLPRTSRDLIRTAQWVVNELRPEGPDLVVTFDILFIHSLPDAYVVAKVVDHISELETDPGFMFSVTKR